jgi:hypothetical protein
MASRHETPQPTELSTAQRSAITGRAVAQARGTCLPGSTRRRAELAGMLAVPTANTHDVNHR